MTKIKTINYIGEEEQQCIMVNSKDHLYITDNQIVSHNTICSGTLSELAFFRESGKSDSYIMRLYNDLKSRIESRMKGNFFGRSILDSSPNDIESPIDNYCWYEAHKDPTNLVHKGARWDWAPEDFADATEKFPVYLGGNGKVAEVITSTHNIDPVDILWVPKEKTIYQLFKNDTAKALKDIAGIPQGSMDRLFPNFDKVEKIFIPKMKNVYSYIVANEKLRPEGLIWDKIVGDFFIRTEKGYKFYYKPYLPRTLHIDQSVSGDCTGIAMVHVEMQKNELGNFEPIYIVDFTVVISPAGGRINLDAIKLFAYDLVIKGNVPLVKITYDTYQSESAIQFLERELSIKVDNLSVDREMGAYLNFSQLIEQNRIRVGRNIFLKNNIKSLRIVKRKRSNSMKVDHTVGDSGDLAGDISWETSLIGYNSKDVSDATAGAIESARISLVESCKEIFDENEIIMTPEMRKSKLSDFMREKGFG